MSEDKRKFLRSVLVGLSSGAIAATAFGSTARAQAGVGWQPTSEPQDSWLDEIAGRHRQVFDTITPDGVARALTFTYTFYAANHDGYGIEPKDLGVVMIFRAGSTPFGFSDVIWKKYGAAMANRSKFVDPTTKQAPVSNIYNDADKASLLPTNGLTLNTLAKMGGRLAICSVATRKLAAALAQDTGSTTDAVFAEFTANVLEGARMVPAGVVAVNRAQEHRFSICYTA